MASVGNLNLVNTDSNINPLSYLRAKSKNAPEVLLIDSATTSNSRLSFTNCNINDAYNNKIYITSRYVLESSNTDFNIYKFSNENPMLLSRYNVDYTTYNSNIAILNVPGIVSPDKIIFNKPYQKSIVFQDNAPKNNSNLFAGIGYKIGENGSNSNLVFHVPYQLSNQFSFLTTDINSNTLEWVRITQSSANIAQVGIGTTIMGPATALATTGDIITYGQANIRDQVITPRFSSCNNTISFSYSKVIDVDTLIVRSNILILQNSTPGNDNYSNLPPNIVRSGPRLPGDGETIDDSYLGANIVRFEPGSNVLSASVLPSIVYDPVRTTLLYTKNFVGLGVRKPEQKFHINGGNQCITSGLLGIGTTNPKSSLHIIDLNYTNTPTMQINSLNSVGILNITGSNNESIMYISPSCNVGIRNNTPSYELDVYGTVRCTCNLIISKLNAVNGINIDCSSPLLNNPRVDTLNVSTIQAPYYNTNYPSAVQAITVNGAMHINRFDPNMLTPTNNLVFGDQTNLNNVGLRVDDCILARSYLTISDKRAKNNIELCDCDDNLSKVLNVNVTKFDYIDKQLSKKNIGFIAQELEMEIPEAVKKIVNAIPDIMTSVILLTNNSFILDKLEIKLNDKLRIKYLDKEYDIDVINIQDDIVYISKQDEFISGDKLFIYGHVINDFRVIETDKLVPLLFSSIQSLYNIIDLQSKILDNLCKNKKI